MSNYFKIFGCERTCTNYWRKLLIDNFSEYEPIKHPWVHGRLYTKSEWLEKSEEDNKLSQAWYDNDVDFYVTTKNPCAWLVSIGRAFGGHLNSDSFPDVDIVTQAEDKLEALSPEECRHDKELLNQFIDKYNKRHEQYKRFLMNDNYMLVRHEDILLSPAPFLAEAQERFCLKTKNNEWSKQSKRVQPLDGDKTQESDNEFDQLYYTQSLYLNDMTEEMEEALENIDWELAEWFGYNNDLETYRRLS